MTATPPLGWIPLDARTQTQRRANEAAQAKMPKFAGPRTGETPPVGTKILLTDLWKHPQVVAAIGKPFTGIHQITGSCVGAGGGNVLFTLGAIQAIHLALIETPIVPFWLLPYGRSRLDMGERGQGEGSMGATFAQACREDGTVDASGSGLPSFTTDDGFVWGQSQEMHWSDGSSIPDSLLQQSRKHLVKTTSELHSAAEVRDAILNYYPVSRAFGSFVNPGSASVKNGALVGRYNGRGGHQESWQGYWHHPDLGELVWERNQWGLKVYGDDPGGGPAGGCWIPFDLVDQACKSGDAEIYAFSQWQGFPAQKFSWLA